ncbi:MAG: glutamate racemase [Nitrospinae bacterium]|nr:glutamate racemase [Nitrospinota bacterium]
MDKRPVGIFDSGIGGLTVLHEIGLLLPRENLVYLGDTARVPYGTKSTDTIIRYSVENTRFLMSKDVKAVVVACNTASAAAGDVLRKSFDVPILGVIEAGVEEAVGRSKSGKIGVIGTAGTIQSGKYEALLRGSGVTKIISAPCPLFVPLAEEGWTDNKVAEEVAKIYLEPFLNGAVDTLILGCTHYPLLEKIIGKVCGGGVALINSANAIARKLSDRLSASALQNDSGAGERKFYFTDSIERARAVGSRFLGENMDSRVQLADLSEFSRH